MNHLPSKVTSALPLDQEVFIAVFKMDQSGSAVFEYINQKFIELHKELGVTVTLETIANTKLEDYFRVYLGFTEEQIRTRISSLKQAVRTLTPYPFKEVSEHPGVPVLVLDSAWRPISDEANVYVIWESRVYLKSEL